VTSLLRTRTQTQFLLPLEGRRGSGSQGCAWGERRSRAARCRAGGTDQPTRQPAQPSVFNLWEIGSREIVEISRCNDNSDGRTPVSDRNEIVPYSAPKGAAIAEPLEGELVMGDKWGTIGGIDPCSPTQPDTSWRCFAPIRDTGYRRSAYRSSRESVNISNGYFGRAIA
jgi:hypothetical protein